MSDKITSTIGIDLSNGSDETAVTVMCGKQVFVIPDPFASAVAARIFELETAHEEAKALVAELVEALRTIRAVAIGSRDELVVAVAEQALAALPAEYRNEE